MTKHPAKFSDNILAEITEQILEHHPNTPKVHVHDPFAGTGRIHRLRETRLNTVPFTTTGTEIEPEWAEMDERTTLGDSTKDPLPEGTTWVATSPCYGNRMAGRYFKEGRQDYTYASTHSGLGRAPSGDSAALLNWGPEYRKFHESVYRLMMQCKTLEGITLNVKDHIRQHQPQGVDIWHATAILEAGAFRLAGMKSVPVRGNRHGVNKGEAIGSHEWVMTFTKVC